MAKKDDSPRKLIAENRRARFEYLIEETLEAGVQLVGTEVKSLRSGRANIAESYASAEKGELWLINATIPEYPPAGQFNHEPRRPRKLLVRSRELKKLVGAVEREGRTLVPLKLYFNDRGIAKVEIALAKGKKAHDKRAATKDRDWKRQQARLMRDRG
ncbi:MAG: SsrA-binding protein SmpB [Hyphomonadaceae bacterium]|nr:SsrA-binding protein SmpB [Hyphomonadaceae bacterium]GIK50644.1 MAG: SsrA-binding protein [Alphaproteobacteria bacterium]